MQQPTKALMPPDLIRMLHMQTQAEHTNRQAFSVSACQPMQDATTLAMHGARTFCALYAQGNQRRGCLSPAESQVSTLLDAVVSPQTTTASPPLVWALWRLST